MKRQTLSGLALLFLLLSAVAVNAQTKVPLNEPDHNRPRLFNQLPAELTLTVADMEQLLLPARAAGKSEALMQGEKKCAVFSLNYISATSQYENKVQTVLLRLKDYPGATLTLSSSTNADGTVAYAGRIISFKHGDMYQLVQKGNSYVWLKRNFYDVVNE